MAIDFKALGAKAAAEGKDMTVAAAGGGDYTPPAEGIVRLRFVGYVELGKHDAEYQGKKKVKEEVQLTFELSGPKHPPREHEGKVYPQLIVVKESLSLNPKANFFKLFAKLNHAGKAKHIAELLGEAYMGTVVHKKYKRKDGSDGVGVNLRDDGGYLIRPTTVQDPETGEPRVIAVDPAITPIKCFLWDYADLEQWATIYVEGQYEERKNDKGEVTAKARSKNVLQEHIKQAKNFPGSPIYDLLVANGQNVDVPTSTQEFDDEPEADEAEVAAPATPAAAKGDPLAGLV
jgi:hypothetical protein